MSRAETTPQGCRTRGRREPAGGARPCTRIAIALALACPLALPAAALEQAPGAWLIFTGTGRFTDAAGATGPWGYTVDVQARYPQLGDGATQYVFRPSIDYRVGERVQLAVGYGRFQSVSAAGVRSSEDRPWQQVGWRVARVGPGTLGLRVRVEERALSTGSEIAVNIRTRLRYDFEFAALAPDWRFSIDVEPFLDLRDTDWGIRDGFTQTRWYAGASHALGSRQRIAVGYLGQHLRASGAPDTLNHLLAVNFAHRF